MSGIGEREWLYARELTFDDMIEQDQSIELIFEGLDTFCDIYLVRYRQNHRIDTVLTTSISPEIQPERR